MPLIKHTCETCDSQYTIVYEEELCEDAPHYCPICGDYMIEDDYANDEEDE